MEKQKTSWIFKTLKNLDYYSGYYEVKKEIDKENDGEEFNMDLYMNFDDIRFEKLISNDGDSAVLYGVKMMHTWRFFVRRQGELEGPFSGEAVMYNLGTLWHFSTMLKYIAIEVMHDWKTVIDSDRMEENSPGSDSIDCHQVESKHTKNKI